MTDIRKICSREGGRGGKDGLDLDFGSLCIGGAHDAVLGCGETVERADRVGGIVARDFGVDIAHERLPDFDGAPTLEDVHPDRTSRYRDYIAWSKWGKSRTIQEIAEAGGMGTGHSLGERLEIGPKELEEGVGIGLDVELHLSLFHNLRRVSLGRAES